MNPLLLTLWLWSAPACGEPPTAYRVESHRIYPVAYLPGIDDDGNVIRMPIYSIWFPAWIQESAEMQAEDGCEPAVGECCVAIVSGVDEAGNIDLGANCP